MQPTSRAFKANAHDALGNANLQKALALMRSGFPGRRATAVARLPEFDALCEQAKAIKDHVLENLDFYLETFERNVVAQGGQMHWCRTPLEAGSLGAPRSSTQSRSIQNTGPSRTSSELGWSVVFRIST